MLSRVITLTPALGLIMHRMRNKQIRIVLQIVPWGRMTGWIEEFTRLFRACGRYGPSPALERVSSHCFKEAREAGGLWVDSSSLRYVPFLRLSKESSHTNEILNLSNKMSIDFLIFFSRSYAETIQHVIVSLHFPERIVARGGAIPFYQSSWWAAREFNDSNLFRCQLVSLWQRDINSNITESSSKVPTKSSRLDMRYW